MSDLDKTAVVFFDKFKQGPAPSAKPRVSPTPVPQAPKQAQSVWRDILQYLNPEPSAQAVQPQGQVAKPSPTPVNPYMNFARKATGLSYK